MDKNKIKYILISTLLVIFAFLSVFNYTNTEKRKAELKKDEYFDNYIECSELRSQCLDLGYASGASEAGRLANQWFSWYQDQKEIIEEYNTKAIVFLSLTGVTLVGEVVVFIIDKKKKQVVEPEEN